MRRTPVLAMVVSGVLFGFHTTPAAAEMIHWSVAQVLDPGPIPAYAIFPPHLGGIDPPGITGNLHFGNPYIMAYTGSMVVPLEPVVIGGKGFFVDGSGGPFAVVIHDSASDQFTPVATQIFVNGGAMDSSTGASTVTAMLAFSDRRYTFSMGQNSYSVLLKLSPILWKPANSDFEGTLYADVRVSPMNAPATPEPSCLVLAGMGIVTVAGAGWRRRRRSIVSVHNPPRFQ